LTAYMRLYAAYNLLFLLKILLNFVFRCPADLSWISAQHQLPCSKIYS
jgi:hypothetical protein